MNLHPLTNDNKQGRVRFKVVKAVFVSHQSSANIFAAWRLREIKRIKYNDYSFHSNNKFE